MSSLRHDSLVLETAHDRVSDVKLSLQKFSEFAQGAGLHDLEPQKEGVNWNTPHDELRTIFHELDEDGSGKLDQDEMTVLCEAIEIDPARVNTMLKHYDEDGDGQLNFDEFSCVFYPDYEQYNVQPASPYNGYNPCPSEEEEEEHEKFWDTTFDDDPGVEEEHEMVHATEIMNMFKQPKLFDGIDPNDINQGGLGDCWLLCALAGMAEFPGLIQACFKDKQINETGKYEVKIWDGTNWNGVIISDYIPVEDQGPLSGLAFGKTAEPIYARPKRGELWVVLLEKALAKWVGGYQNLDGGHDVCAWRLLVGESAGDKCKVMFQDDNGAWTLHDCSFPDPKTIDCDHINPRPVDCWDTLWKWENKNAILGAVTFRGEATGEKGHSGGEDFRSDNIVLGHAYSVLQCVHFPEDDLRLVQLRNPWGFKEWNGPFSDGSPEWKEHKHLKEALGVEKKR